MDEWDEYSDLDISEAQELDFEDDYGLADGFKDMSRAGGGGEDDYRLKDEREWFITQLTEINGKGVFHNVFSLDQKTIQSISESNDLRFLNPHMLLCAFVWIKRYDSVKIDRENRLRNFHETFRRNTRDKFEPFATDLARYVRLVKLRWG